MTKMRRSHIDGRVLVAALILFFCCLLWPTLATAASEVSGETAEVALPKNLTQPEVRELISRLSDDEVRALLISQLDKIALSQDASGRQKTLEESLADLYRRSTVLWAGIPELPSLGSFLVEKVTAGKPGSHIWSVLLFMAVIFIGAGIVEWLFRRLFTRLGQLAHGGEIETTVDRLCVAGLRIVIDLFAIGVFILAAVGIYFVLYDEHEATNALISEIFWGVVAFRLVLVLADALFSPDEDKSRLLPLDDAAAKHGYRRTLLITVLIVIAFQAGNLLQRYELAEGPRLAEGAIASLIVLAAIVAMIWRDRMTVAAMILPSEASEPGSTNPAREFLAANWHVLASCYILGLWLFGMIARLLTGEGQGGTLLASLLLLPAVPTVDWLARAGIRRLCEGSEKDRSGKASDTEREEATFTDLDAMHHEEAGVPQHPPATPGEAFEPVLIRNMRVVLGLFVVLILAQIWGLDLHNVAAASMSERVADALFEIIVTLILAWAIWGFVKSAITYYAPHEGIDVDQMIEGEAGGTGLSRAQTLLPLFRKFILITLIVIVTLVVLSSLGVSIAPLIAGAGVIGLAIGFGAQTLVRDIISGAFFLADDAFRLGEYIDVGVAKGMVERISVRSFRLRHHNGPINTIPFGEVQKVTNYSRDWVMMKLQMRVPSDTDLEKLRKVVKKVGQQMMEEPEFSANLLQPVKSQGVYRMDDDGAFVIRVKFMCKPGEQFVLRREVFRRVQEAFAANGIRFAPKRVMVDAGPGASDKEIAAAASAAITPAQAEAPSDAL
jgi:small-conductance mechanosensitive channel